MKLKNKIKNERQKGVRPLQTEDRVQRSAKDILVLN